MMNSEALIPCCTTLGKFLNLSELEFPTERGDSDSTLTQLLWRKWGDPGKELSTDPAESKNPGTLCHYYHKVLCKL